jgi:hypothetical protein
VEGVFLGGNGLGEPDGLPRGDFPFPQVVGFEVVGRADEWRSGKRRDKENEPTVTYLRIDTR